MGFCDPTLNFHSCPLIVAKSHLYITSIADISIMSGIRALWGSGQSRGFKLAAWGVAITVFGAWQVYQPFGTPVQIPISVEVERKKGDK